MGFTAKNSVSECGVANQTRQDDQGADKDDHQRLRSRRRINNQQMTRNNVGIETVDEAQET